MEKFVLGLEPKIHHMVEAIDPYLRRGLENYQAFRETQRWNGARTVNNSRM